MNSFSLAFQKPVTEFKIKEMVLLAYKVAYFIQESVKELAHNCFRHTEEEKSNILHIFLQGHFQKIHNSIKDRNIFIYILFLFHVSPCILV